MSVLIIVYIAGASSKKKGKRQKRLSNANTCGELLGDPVAVFFTVNPTA
jgi:hypothetical protein